MKYKFRKCWYGQSIHNQASDPSEKPAEIPGQSEDMKMTCLGE